MRVNREELLKSLESVSPGLATREIVEQSTCFVLRDGLVQTFNDEVACTTSCPLKVTGAVPAAPLSALLGKLAEPELDISVVGNELQIKGKGRRAALRLEAEVMLAVDAVEQPADDAWQTLPGEFCEAIDLVGRCASSDSGGNFNLTCVHIHPEWLEACDNFQLARYPLATPLAGPCLVRQASVKHIVGLGVTQVAETPSWLHFRNAAGLVLSARRWSDPYDDMTAFLEVDGARAALPGGLAEAVAKAEVFSSENAEGNHIQVDLKAGRLRLKGTGASGWYEEQKQVKYDGPPLSFLIAPKLLASLAERANECIVAPGRLLIATGKISYVACLISPDNAPAVERVEEEVEA